MEDSVGGEVVCDWGGNGTSCYFSVSHRCQSVINESCCIGVYRIVSGWGGDCGVEVVLE